MCEHPASSHPHIPCRRSHASPAAAPFFPSSALFLSSSPPTEAHLAEGRRWRRLTGGTKGGGTRGEGGPWSRRPPPAEAQRVGTVRSATPPPPRQPAVRGAAIGDLSEFQPAGRLPPLTPLAGVRRHHTGRQVASAPRRRRFGQII